MVESENYCRQGETMQLEEKLNAMELSAERLNVTKEAGSENWVYCAGLPKFTFKPSSKVVSRALACNRLTPKTEKRRSGG
jgi:hypothetical protein